MADNYKIRVQYNLAGLGVSTNVFWVQNTIGVSPPDNLLLDALEGWVEDIYTGLAAFMSDEHTFRDGIVDEVDAAGLVIRTVGSIAPNIDGQNVNDTTALTTAGSSFVRTAVPRVKGSKRWPGLVEAGTINGLFTNQFLAAIAEATLVWLAGPGAEILLGLVAGVISEKAGDFVPFADSGVATNVPGTQVTRKPLRGE